MSANLAKVRLPDGSVVEGTPVAGGGWALRTELEAARRDVEIVQALIQAGFPPRALKGVAGGPGFGLVCARQAMDNGLPLDIAVKQARQSWEEGFAGPSAPDGRQPEQKQPVGADERRVLEELPPEARISLARERGIR